MSTLKQKCTQESLPRNLSKCFWESTSSLRIVGTIKPLHPFSRHWAIFCDFTLISNLQLSSTPKSLSWISSPNPLLLPLLLSHFSCVRLCVTPQMAAHQAPLSLGFSRQEYWNGLPFPSPMHACMLSCFSHVRLCVTLWTTAHQVPLSTGFSRQEYVCKLNKQGQIQL